MRRSTLSRSLVFLALCAVASPAEAGEGGSSHYMPGTQGDFAMALLGPRGVYLRNDAMYLKGTIGSVTLGDRIYASAKQRVLVNTVKGIYLGGETILGSRWGTVLSVPLVIDADVSGDLVEPLVGSREGSLGGLGDISLTPLLNWQKRDFHFTLGCNVFMPTGSYDKGRTVNLGRNYWSFDPTFAFTWLDPKRGHEVSFIAGCMLNTRNTATDYQTGREFHVDFTAAQHLSKRFAIGALGYWYRQLSDDSGALLDRANATLPALGLEGLGGFRGRAFGLGGGVTYTASLGGRDVTFILKGLWDLERENRFDNRVVMLSVALKL